jgi:hypothetical protein
MIKSRTGSMVQVAIVVLLATGILCGYAVQAQERTETKTLGEWVMVYKAEQKAAYDRHPDLPDIEKGASMFLTAIGQNPRTKVGRRDLTDLGRRYYDAYKNFIDGPGKAMLAKWQKDGRLDPKDDDFKWVIQATAAKFENLRKHTGGKGRQVDKLVVKAYFREPMTREEVDSMRLVLAGMGKSPGWTCGVYSLRPRNIRNWSYTGLIKWPDHFETLNGIPHGSVAPDIRFLRFDVLDAGPIKTVPFEFSLDALVTPRGIASLNDCISSLQMTEKDGKRIFTPDYSDFDNAKPEAVFSLYTELKKGKPVFVFTEGTSNTFDYILDVFSKECLYQLFKDSVTFFQHDFRSPGADYGSGKRYYMHEIWRGLPFTDAQYVSTYRRFDYDMFAAETRDQGYMRYPVASVPMLLDTLNGANILALGMPVKSDYFFDTNRVQCAWVNPKSKGGRYSLMDQNKEPFYTAVNKGLIPGTSYVHLYTTHFRQKILFMKIMESLNWKYAADSELLKTFYKECLGKIVPYQDLGLFEIRNGVVDTIDKDVNTISVKGKVWKLKNAKEETHVIDMGGRPRVCFETEEGVQAGGRIADIAPGDKVHAFYQLTHGADSKKILRSLMVGEKAVSHIRNYDLLWLSHLFWVTGNITAINQEDGTITVNMPRPDTKNGEWRGFKYWQEAMDKFGSKLPKNQNQTTRTYAIGKRMLDGDYAARTFELTIDSGVEMSVNGMIQYDMSGIKVDDKVSFSFSMIMNNKHPKYYPWHVMVVTKDKLTSIPMPK